jgi:hypothetical protein
MPNEQSADKLVRRLLRKSSPDLEIGFQSLPDTLKRSILESVSGVSSASRRFSSANTDMIRLVKKLVAEKSSVRIGLLDLGAWVSGLPKLLTVLNKAQTRFAFLELQTPVPVGLIKTKIPLTEWAELHLGKKLSAADKRDLTRNMLAEEFYFFAESVRVERGLDFVMGLTSAMIAFLDEGSPCWNFYAAGEGKVALISTFDLREYATEAERPFEAAVGMLVVGQVLATRNDDLDYHRKSRGCMFDFNEKRDSLVKSIKAMRIENVCLEKIKDDGDRKAAIALVNALSKMQR